MQGSGWGALAWEPMAGRLIVEQIYDHQGNVGVGAIPLFVIDAWEHAFYLQYLNDKGAFVDAVWEIANWADVAERFAAARSHADQLTVGGAACPASGTRSTNVAPPPGVGCADTSPPWASTMVAVIDSPRPDPPLRAGARGVGAVEALEHLVQLLRRQPRPVVDDRQHAPTARRRLHRDLDRRARRGVDAGVGDDVGDRLREPVAIADDDARLGASP